MESTMPQNNPMSVIETVKAICGCFENQSVKVFAIEDIIKARDAQLIRSTLEAAAERAVAWSYEKHPQGAENWPIDKISGYLDEGMRKAILAPLTKPATAHKNDGQTA